MLRGLVLLALAYGGLVVIARAAFRAVLYPAPSASPVDLGGDVRVVTCRASDGVEVRALEMGDLAASRVVVLFHGNGETANDNVPLGRLLVERGTGFVAAEYRGYGLSKAAAPPTEAGLYADAEAVLEDLARRGVTPERVLLWGSSLGTGVAVEMARRGRGRALVLLAPYTSITAMARRVAPFLPAKLVALDAFDTASKAPGLDLPALVVHGELDALIPPSMGREVAGLLPRATFLPVARGNHADLLHLAGDEIVQRALQL